jgi:hypothetical protein
VIIDEYCQKKKSLTQAASAVEVTLKAISLKKTIIWFYKELGQEARQTVLFALLKKLLSQFKKLYVFKR